MRGEFYAALVMAEHFSAEATSMNSPLPGGKQIVQGEVKVGNSRGPAAGLLGGMLGG